MEEFSNTIAPKARDRGLVMRQLSDETLIYDLERDQAHCLSTVAGLVWNYCDGSTSIRAMAERLSSELQRDVDETTVWQALTELDEAELLEPEAAKVQGVMSRRQMVATMGAALSIPLITSLAIPTAAMAASTGNCIQPGFTCSTNNDCCSGTFCSGSACCYMTGNQGSFICQHNTECCGGICAGGQCADCTQKNSKCAQDAQCCQGLVCLNSALCEPCINWSNGDKTPCTKDSDCCPNPSNGKPGTCNNKTSQGFGHCTA